MSGKVVILRPVERVRQDAEPIALMYRNMGTATAEQVVSRALSELSLTVAGLAEQAFPNPRADLSRPLRRLQRMAEQMGFVSLGLVAADCRACLDRDDPVASAAVWARMLRIAEQSLRAERAELEQKP